MRSIILIIIFILFSSDFTCAQANFDAKRLLTNEDIRSFRLVKKPQLSPNGNQVLFETQESAESGGLTHIWQVDTQGKNARQITYSAQGEQTGEVDPMWSQDGSIFFLSKRGGDKHKLFRLSPQEGDAVPLNLCTQAVTAMDASRQPVECKENLDVENYFLSPDGQWVALIAREPKSEDEMKRLDTKNDAVIVGDEPHPQQLWLYSMRTHSLQSVTGKKWNVATVAWNLQSTRLAIISNPLGGADDLGTHHETWIYSLDDLNRPVHLVQAPLTASQLSWSPDGQKLAITAQAESDTPPGVWDLYIIPLFKTNKPIVNLNHLSLSLSDEVPTWDKQGKGVYIEVIKGTEKLLAHFSLEEKTTSFTFLNLPSTKQFATNAKQSGWVFVGEATDKAPEVRFVEHLSSKFTKALTLSNPQWQKMQWARSELVHWRSPDGTPVEGFLTFQEGAIHPSSKPIPLIVIPHGGPTGVSTRGFLPLSQLLAAKGWAVFAPNVRGSLGYGHDFSSANRNDLGNGDYQDIISGVDFLITHYPIDIHRLAVYGFSYGGEMAAFMEGKTDRFAAIVTGAPVINQLSEYGTEDASWYDRWFYGQPWLRLDDAWRQSPLSYVKNAKTPLLLIHGQDDDIDPVGQSQEMYRALKQQGIEVGLVLYPRENHFQLRDSIMGMPSVEPWHGFDARERIIQWFEHHFDLPKR